MKGIEFALLAAGAVAGAFVRYKMAESPLILGTLPVNILIIPYYEALRRRMSEVQTEIE